jgi:hypothetical protein
MSVDAREPVIDLGIVTAHDAAAAPDDRPFRRPRLTDRRLLAVLVAALCLLTMGASALPRPALLRVTAVLPYQQNGTFDVTARAAYVVVGGAEPTLSAYALPGGRQLWTSPLEWPSAGVNAEEAAGVVLVAGGDRVTVALDAATGRERWRRPGLLGASTGGAALLADYADEDGLLRALRSVRLTDGAPLWSRDVEADHGWMLTSSRPGGTPEPDRIVTVMPDGRVSVLRLTDGGEVAAGRVVWRAQTGRDTGFTEVNAEGGALYVGRHEPAGITVTAYALDTLTRLWDAPGAPPGGPSPCGAVLCLNDETGMAGYDRGTGAARWRADGHTYAEPLAPGRLLAGDGAELESFAVLDDHTGRVVADLGVGAPVRTGGRTLFLRPERSDGGRTTVGVLDPATGGLHVLGALGDIYRNGCKAAGAHLVCTAVPPAPNLQVITSG